MISRLIFDVQILLRGIAGSPTTLTGGLYKCFRGAELRLVFSSDLLAEVARVLDYSAVQRLGITSGVAFQAATDLLLLGEYVAPVPRYEWPSLSDKKDWYLLDLLYTSCADALITEDKQLLKVGRELKLPILRPIDLKTKNFKFLNF